MGVVIKGMNGNRNAGLTSFSNQDGSKSVFQSEEAVVGAPDYGIDIGRSKAGDPNIVGKGGSTKYLQFPFNRSMGTSGAAMGYLHGDN